MNDVFYFRGVWDARGELLWTRGGPQMLHRDLALRGPDADAPAKQAVRSANLPGLELPEPLISATCIVPALVPSVAHNS